MFKWITSFCPVCKGIGRVRATFDDGRAQRAYYTDCTHCNGAGFVPRAHAAQDSTGGSSRSGRLAGIHPKGREAATVDRDA